MCNNKTRLTLFWSDRVVDRQVRLQTDIRDPSGEGSCVRVANHLHPRETARSSGRRYGDHPVQLSRRLSKWLPSLRPRPCKCWHQRRGWGRLSHVLCQFLGAGLVPRSVILEWSDNDKSIIMYYYIIIASLLHIIKSIITCYYIIVTSLLRHYYAIISNCPAGLYEIALRITIVTISEVVKERFNTCRNILILWRKIWPPPVKSFNIFFHF